ncbi:GNAT family N-acetyltransferase [Streptomyces sp. NPDC091292]|uniref:GNAT family N-acetyltransferase n=1 Tax=Streptomyces sp. NPDC091292 TaxID=3365991 RepID=UPI00382A26C6
MEHVIRAVRADEWPQVKELRLAALLDPAAPVAFLETYDDACPKPDVFWQGRTAQAAQGVVQRQFVAEGADGTWGGTVVVLIEEPGALDFFGRPVIRRQAQLVGVFVRAEHRGTGLTEALFDAALEWAWSVDGIERVRLFVHQDNGRAEGFYRKVGFVPTGVTVMEPAGPGRHELYDHELVIDRPAIDRPTRD